MSKKNNLLVAASGTGGHIFPALAVSKEVEDEWNIHWLGVSQRLDASFIPEKYNLRTLNINCLLYTSPSPRDRQKSRMPSSA